MSIETEVQTNTPPTVEQPETVARKMVLTETQLSFNFFQTVH